jgi:hypothetical protein
VSNKISKEQKDMKHYKGLKLEKHHSAGSLLWKVLKGGALVLGATAVLANLSDIKRYIKISTM